MCEYGVHVGMPTNLKGKEAYIIGEVNKAVCHLHCHIHTT